MVEGFIRVKLRKSKRPSGRYRYEIGLPPNIVGVAGLGNKEYVEVAFDFETGSLILRKESKVYEHSTRNDDTQ